MWKLAERRAAAREGGQGAKDIVVVVVVIDGNVDGNGGHWRPRTATRLLLPGEDGSGDGS